MCIRDRCISDIHAVCTPFIGSLCGKLLTGTNTPFAMSSADVYKRQALGVIGVQQRNKVGCLRLGKLRFCFGNPIKQESDFLLNVPDNGIGGFDPAVELAFLGAYALLKQIKKLMKKLLLKST